MDQNMNQRLDGGLDSEKALLGVIILNAAESMPRVLETKLQADDFFKESHGDIFTVLTQLYDKGEPIDLLTTSNALRKKKLLDKVGGDAYIAELADAVGIPAHATSYAEMIVDRSTVRKLIAISGKIYDDCKGVPQSVDEVLDSAEAAIYGIRNERGNQSLQHVPGLLTEAFSRINALSSKGDGLTGIPSGFGDFDSLTGGLQKSDLIIIAGRPSMGKTALALNLALGAALPIQRQLHKNLPPNAVAIFSLEMSTEQLLQRLICQTGRLDLKDLRTGRLKHDDIQRLTEAISRLEQADIYIDDTPAIRTLELRAKARRLKSQLESRNVSLGLILVDYLQLMRGNTRLDSREQEISEISRGLKSLAKELNVPVIALSQLNRRVEDRPDKRPMLSDLRESGAIEQDADLIAFVYREEVYKKDHDELRGKAELIVGKHRNGPTGVINLTFQHQFSSFGPAEKFSDY